VTSGATRRAAARAACVLAAVLAATAGCRSASRPAPGLELDVARYVARVERWATTERRVAAAIADVFRSQFLDATLVTSISERVQPDVDAHLAEVATYVPQTEQVRAIHERYTRAWRHLREGFRLIHDGMKADDPIQLADGRRRLEVWQEEMIAIAGTLRRLAEDAGLRGGRAASRGAGTAPNG
jgi:hypothetical protein